MARYLIDHVFTRELLAFYGNLILQFASVLLLIMLCPTVLQAKSLEQEGGIFQLNDDVLSIFYSVKAGQSNLKEGNIQIGEPNMGYGVLTIEKSDRIKSVSLVKNQGLLSLLTENSISNKDAYAVVKILYEHFNVNAIPAGKAFQLTFDEQLRFQSIGVKLAFAESLEVKRSGQKFIVVKNKSPTTLKKYYVEGEIVGSLYASCLRLGLNNGALAKLNEILSYEIDFQREVRSGDRFSIFYSTLRDDVEGDEVFHEIYFAKVTLKNDSVSLYHYEDSETGMVDYLDPRGKSSRSFLIKTPLKNARLSSYYGRRKHPVLGYTRMHKGLDFGAPSGMPILATGDGTIERASYFGSFGNYIRISHKSGVQTIYAHLKGYAKGIKTGVKVEQGQVIGYLGATGRVKGRHLHYEIHKNGKAVDPLRLDLPASSRLSGESLERYYEFIETVDEAIKAYKAQEE
ncbi:M23 family metallopeptidase [Microbulbifer variabilis]|uniref:M23 family metallopeptidase n=1 Tax=Microbulbifer variabilis TaxID=266805 RepID=UPI001CFF4943|nr:M23 family metallopeptidase [Microbulbifer variabilis]